MKGKLNIYKLSQSQATEIMNIGNQTGFHHVVIDYGYGLCIDILSDNGGYADERLEKILKENGITHD